MKKRNKWTIDNHFLNRYQFRTLNEERVYTITPEKITEKVTSGISLLKQYVFERMIRYSESSWNYLSFCAFVSAFVPISWEKKREWNEKFHELSTYRSFSVKICCFSNDISEIRISVIFFRTYLLINESHAP